MHTVKGEMKADPARIKEIATLLPAKPDPVLLVSAKDRTKWEAVPKEQATSGIDAAAARLKSGMPAWDDEAYLDYTRKGKRTGDSMMANRAGHLNTLVLGECLEYKGRFIPAICEAVESLASDKSWTLPAHDSKLDNYEGRKIEIDLSAAARSLIFAGTLRLLEDVLPEKTKALLRSELERHIFAPYRTRFVKGSDFFWWMEGDNNWNAVCHAGVVLAALSVLEKPEDRALFINGAEQGVPWFIHGMPDDGYCTEGIGYWGYGFGNYVLLAMGIREATSGKIDWFQNQKIAAIGRFGRRMELMSGVYPAYADCSPVARPSEWIMYFMDRLYDPGKLSEWKDRVPVSIGDPQTFCQSLLGSTVLFHSAPPLPALAVKGGDGLRDFFNIAGVLNSRPKDPTAADAIAVSLKGGHNAEEHNHNDVGSFVVSTPNARPPLILDPGNEVYTARTFSAKRYDSKALSSWGHGVPLVDGQQQHPGRDAEAVILKSEFSDNQDVYVLDLTKPYSQVDGLTSLKRSFTYTRSPKNSLRIEDEMVGTKPMAFGNALLTYDKWKQTGPKTLVFFGNSDALEVTIECEGAPQIQESIIDEDMGFRRKPTRVGISLAAKQKEAKIALVIKRIDASGFAGGSLANEGRADRLGVHSPDEGGAVTVEAESFSAQTGGKIDVVSKIGASGMAFKGWDEAGHKLTWTFKVPKAGNYAIDLRYCCADDTSRELFVDGLPVGPRTNVFRFAATGGWSSDKNNWKNVTLASPKGAWRFPLAAGDHQIAMTSLGGGMNLDWLRLVPAEGREALNANPTLEDADKDGIPDQWAISPPANGSATKTTLSVEDKRNTLTLTDRDKENGLGLLQIIPVKPGQTYRESARLKGDNIAFYFNWLDKNGKLIGKEIAKSMTAGKDTFAVATWEEKAPAEAASLRFWIYTGRANQSETKIQEPVLEEVVP